MKTIEFTITVDKMLTYKVKANSVEEAIQKLEQRVMKTCKSQNFNHPNLYNVQYTDGSMVENDWSKHLNYLDY